MTPLRSWIAAPGKITALFLVVAAASAVGLVWTGVRLFRQDRALEAQRLEDRREAAAGLSRLPNLLVIEGHTDAQPYRFTSLNGYSNWELSVDRANAARHSMQDHGVRPGQVAQIRGFADRHLLNPADPNNSRNRRISVVVEYDKASSGPV